MKKRHRSPTHGTLVQMPHRNDRGIGHEPWTSKPLTSGWFLRVIDTDTHDASSLLAVKGHHQTERQLIY